MSDKPEDFSLLSDDEKADLEWSRRAIDMAERKAFWESHWEARESIGKIQVDPEVYGSLLILLVGVNDSLEEAIAILAAPPKPARLQLLDAARAERLRLLRRQLAELERNEQLNEFQSRRSRRS